MKKGISFMGYLPIRRDPTGTSEMISQVLFGEEFSILDEKAGWLFISMDIDGSEGWVTKECIQWIVPTDETLNPPEPGFRIVTHPFITALDLNSGLPCILPAGSLWPSVSKASVHTHQRNFEVLSQDGLTLPGPGADLEEIGKRLLSLPSIHGGRCAFGFDGPGLVQMLCRIKGVLVPRTSIRQSGLGTTINFMLEVKMGDLAFFDNEEGDIEHVGLLLEGGRIIHVHHSVRIDRFDQQGIYSADRDRYTHKLRIIKRIGEQRSKKDKV